MRSKRHTAGLAGANSTPSSSMGRHPADSTRQALAQAFLKRSVKMLERVSSSASSEALKSALSSPTDIGGVATLLSDLAPLGVDLCSAGGAGRIRRLRVSSLPVHFGRRDSRA